MYDFDLKFGYVATRKYIISYKDMIFSSNFKHLAPLFLPSRRVKFSKTEGGEGQDEEKM